MSYNNLVFALEKAKEKSYYRIRGKTTQQALTHVEKLLGFSLSIQHREFYEKVGYLSFAGYEFYGICNNDITGNTALCAIETTLLERKKYGLSKSWIIFCSFDDGYLGYLDYSKLNSNGEPPLIMALYDGKEYHFIKKVSEDIGDYLKKCIENC